MLSPTALVPGEIAITAFLDMQTAKVSVMDAETRVTGRLMLLLEL